jgi:hypothetical protein
VTARWRRAVVALVALFAAPAVARAQDAPAPIAVGITYARRPGAEACPNESGIRDALIARLGSAVELRDVSDELPTIAITIAREGGSYVARWVKTGPKSETGAMPWNRDEDADCGALVWRTALTIAVAIRAFPASRPPPAVDRGAPSPAPQALPVAEPAPLAPPAPPPPVPPPPARTPGVFEGSAGSWRIVAFVLAGAELATGGGLVAAANGKAAAVHGVQSMVGPNGCAVPSATCTNLDTLLRAHDAYANAAIGLLVAGVSCSRIRRRASLLSYSSARSIPAR